MFRCAARRKIGCSSSTITRRTFHVSSSRGASREAQAILDTVSSHGLVFHHLFQQTHDWTALPWLASIPLATVLARSLITPVRYYIALCHRDQRRAESDLRFAAKIIETQGEARLSAGEDVIKNEAWKKKEWIARRHEIERTYKFAVPTALHRNNLLSSIANIGAQGLVLINTSTILALNMKHPEFSELVNVQEFKIPLVVCFTLLAILNSSHYSNFSLAKFVQHNASTGINPFRWNETEVKVIQAVLLPIWAGTVLKVCPDALVVSAISTSIYTLLERKLIVWFARAPDRGFTGAATSDAKKSHRDAHPNQRYHVVP